MTAGIQKALDALAEDFDLLDDWEARIQYVIDLGQALPPFPEDQRTDDNRVSGCASRVWLVADRRDGRLYLQADSDSHLSKGSAAVVLALFNGQPPQDILDFDIRGAFDRLGLPSALTPQRANGLNAMVQRVRTFAAQGA